MRSVLTSLHVTLRATGSGTGDGGETESSMVTQSFKDLCSKQSQELLTKFKEVADQLYEIAKDSDIPWDHAIADTRKSHNNYAFSFLACYASKAADLSESLLSALDRFDLLHLCVMRSRANRDGGNASILYHSPI